MIATLTPIPDGTCTSDIATDMADVIISFAVELSPRSKRSREAQRWCARPGGEADTNAAWQQREEARKNLREEPHNSNLRKVCKDAVQCFFWVFVRKLETRVREGNQAGLY